MWFGIVTLFPEMFSVLEQGITGRALKSNLIKVACFNPRDFTQNKHRNVDDAPYGGGPGMVMMAEPLHLALKAAKNATGQKATVIHLSPQGKIFNQEAASELQQKENLIFIACEVTRTYQQVLLKLNLKICRSLQQ